MEVEEPNENYGNGWVRLFRSLTNKGWYTKSEYVHLWVHLIFKANHTGKEWFHKGISHKSERGQFITSRKSLSEETGIDESKIERILKCFQNEQQIEQQNMFTKRLISILNYDSYQKSEQVFEQQVNSKRTASEQQVNTTKEFNELKELKKNTDADLSFPYKSEKFLSVWSTLRKSKKWRNKEFEALQMNLTKLSKVSEKDAVQMMENSIAGEWQGLFDLKQNGLVKKEEDNRPKSQLLD